VLSYRHSYHAGNFADVLKHIVLVEILQHFCKKETPFDYIDSHAGAGLYSLDSDHSDKLQEYADGIGKLQSKKWPELRAYFDAIDAFNSGASLSHYPGSPMIAQHFLRPHDRSWLFELHPSDVKHLERNIAGNRYSRVSQSDGFKGMLAQLPPASRRAAILIDPPYEIKSDYQEVFNSVVAAHKKFSSGCYAIWYPVVERARIKQLEKNFSRSGIRNIQRFELAIRADTEEKGMTATGMIVVNPPWTLFEKMQLLLPKLVTALGKDSGAFSRCDILVPE
jgi:23S rRNA (adenine2030-N6)-methyltransferase